MPRFLSPGAITDVFREWHSAAVSAPIPAGLAASAPLGFTVTAGDMAVSAGNLSVPGGTLTLGANGTAITQMRVYAPTLTPASVAINVSAEQTFSVPGLTTADTVIVNGPSPTAGTGIMGARVSGADTLALTFVNVTIGILTPASGTYRILAVRS